MCLSPGMMPPTATFFAVSVTTTVSCVFGLTTETKYLPLSRVPETLARTLRRSLRSHTWSPS